MKIGSNSEQTRANGASCCMRSCKGDRKVLIGIQWLMFAVLLLAGMGTVLAEAPTEAPTIKIISGDPVDIKLPSSTATKKLRVGMTNNTGEKVDYTVLYEVGGGLWDQLTLSASSSNAPKGYAPNRFAKPPDSWIPDLIRLNNIGTHEFTITAWNAVGTNIATFTVNVTLAEPEPVPPGPVPPPVPPRGNGRTNIASRPPTGVIRVNLREAARAGGSSRTNAVVVPPQRVPLQVQRVNLRRPSSGN